MRIISHVGFIDHSEHLFSTLQIMNIYQINKYMCCILMFKHNKAMLPTLFNDVFVLSPMTHKYCTRQKFAYKIPFCRTKCRQLSLAYVGPKIWNTFLRKSLLCRSCGTLSLLSASERSLRSESTTERRALTRRVRLSKSTPSDVADSFVSPSS